jgi:hypothetical protein
LAAETTGIVRRRRGFDIEPRIFEIRGHRAMLDRDLAEVYGVQTRVLNQAVRRNADRFPEDFAFQLSLEEAEEIRRSRSQSVTLKRGQNVKYRPWAFTEHGAIMAATVLNSQQAVEMSVFVVRAFVRLREFARGHREIVNRLDALEKRVAGHDEDLQQMFQALRVLLDPARKSGRRIGFRPHEEQS